MSNYSDQIAAKETALNTLRESVRQREVIFEFLSRNRSVINNEANLNVIRGFFGGTLEGVTVQMLEDALQNTTLYNSLALQDVEAEREKLVQTILRNRVMSPETEQSEKERLLNPKMTDITTVRRIADNVVNRRAIEAQDLTDRQLRELARGPEVQHPVLPESLRTAAAIKALSPSELKFAMKKYGSAQLDFILQSEVHP